MNSCRIFEDAGETVVECLATPSLSRQTSMYPINWLGKS